jgi:hypothetical protein
MQTGGADGGPHPVSYLEAHGTQENRERTDENGYEA